MSVPFLFEAAPLKVNTQRLDLHISEKSKAVYTPNDLSGGRKTHFRAQKRDEGISTSAPVDYAFRLWLGFAILLAVWNCSKGEMLSNPLVISELKMAQ